ncbi:DUF5662 family protein [Tannockella kyphosi]|uniref:DUF5662 family protein n=1 Tax=Tannockella kyphosi TaxID=2899121 RepID=UPI0020126C97|nr:DUF5662 family protein [Tannockella kyphosi]
MALLKHLKVINKHKYHVTRLCFRCGLYKQGILHDLSKYSPIELATGAKYFDGTRSPNGVERMEKGYSEAWLHHKGRNKHHWEYWVDFGLEGPSAAPMPMCYLIESFLDRIGATIVYRGKDFKVDDPLIYYNRTRPYYIIEEKTDEILLDLLNYLANSDIDQTIEYIKKEYVNKTK